MKYSYIRWYTRRRLLALVAGCCILAFLANLQASRPQPNSYERIPQTKVIPPPSVDAPSSPSVVAKTRSKGCDAYPEKSDVVIVVKTGATEVFQKVPTLLVTYLQCSGDDLLLFSDLEQKLGEHHIYDSLDEVVENARKDNPDFDLYNAQKEYRLSGNDASSLSDRGSDAWKLDKYKNIHTARKAWRMRPDRSWYFFIDADTYIVWTNFFQWLKRLDPAEKLYIGSRVNIGDPPFAHGGSGYLVSRAAMLTLVGEDGSELAAKYDINATTGCCGDQELGRTLYSKGINVTNMRPMINGEAPRSIPFGPTQWCQPLITMHHISAEEICNFWEFELQRENPLESFSISDLFHAYIAPHILPYRPDWDNLANDDKFEAPSSPDSSSSSRWWKWNEPYKSFNTCRKKCEEDARCFQYSYHGETCTTSASFKLGRKRNQADGYKSGWVMEKIERWKKENPCENGPDWEKVELW